MLSSANILSGKILSVSASLSAYLDLKNINSELTVRNAALAQEVIRLQHILDSKEIEYTRFDAHFLSDTVLPDSMLPSAAMTYRFIPAAVVNNSTQYLKNYITIDKGASDGVRPDMGVVSPFGVAGKVMTVGEHFSVVISLLNEKLYINCKVRNTNYNGPLSWKGDDPRYAYLEELPSYSTFKVGDTIVTSGYSTSFPPGIMVGVVESFAKQHDDNFFALKVRLGTNFHTVNSLCVIDNSLDRQQKAIEKEALKYD